MPGRGKVKNKGRTPPKRGEIEVNKTADDHTGLKPSNCNEHRTENSKKTIKRPSQVSDLVDNEVTAPKTKRTKPWALRNDNRNKEKNAGSKKPSTSHQDELQFSVDSADDHEFDNNEGIRSTRDTLKKGAREKGGSSARTTVHQGNGGTEQESSDTQNLSDSCLSDSDVSDFQDRG